MPARITESGTLPFSISSKDCLNHKVHVFTYSLGGHGINIEVRR